MINSLGAIILYIWYGRISANCRWRQAGTGRVEGCKRGPNRLPVFLRCIALIAWRRMNATHDSLVTFDLRYAPEQKVDHQNQGAGRLRPLASCS
jgi:hypothetical protein